jgi:hypothetical protein
MVEMFLWDVFQGMKTYNNLNIWITVNSFFGNINHDPISKVFLQTKSNQMCLSPAPDGNDLHSPTP